MEFTLKNCFLSFFVVGLSLTLFFSCSSYKIEKYVEYQTNCINCGTSSDGIIQVEIIQSVKSDSSVFITIKNLSDETVIMDDKLFTGSQDGKIVMIPVGTENPYLRYSNSFLNLSSESIPKYNIFLGYTSQLKYEQGTTTIYQYDPITPLPIPPKTTVNYYIKNYPLSLVNERITLEKKWDDYNYTINWDNVNFYIKRMSESIFGLHLIYRKINETVWRNYDLIYKLTNIAIVKKKIK